MIYNAILISLLVLGMLGSCLTALKAWLYKDLRFEDILHALTAVLAFLAGSCVIILG